MNRLQNLAEPNHMKEKQLIAGNHPRQPERPLLTVCPPRPDPSPKPMAVGFWGHSKCSHFYLPQRTKVKILIYSFSLNYCLV